MRGNKDKDLRDPSAGDALETHLSRAKARSQAIAEQYTKHYTQEAYNLRQKMSTAGTAPTAAIWNVSFLLPTNARVRCRVLMGCTFARAIRRGFALHV